MPTLFDPAARDALLARIGRLAADRRPRWGRFTAPEMVCHVTSDLRCGLGELDGGPPRGPLTRAPLNWFVIYVMPWPKGRGKSPPELLAVRPTTWDADLARLVDAVTRFSARGPGGSWPVSPVFGHISGRSWGAMVSKHLDYHLSQFGA